MDNKERLENTKKLHEQWLLGFEHDLQLKLQEAYQAGYVDGQHSVGQPQMDRLQDDVQEWIDRVLPGQTIESVLAHFCEEAIELAGVYFMQHAISQKLYGESYTDQIRIPEGGYNSKTYFMAGNMEEEAADVLALLFAIASLKGFRLQEAFESKFNEVRNARFEYDPKVGYRKRVKENKESS